MRRWAYPSRSGVHAILLRFRWRVGGSYARGKTGEAYIRTRWHEGDVIRKLRECVHWTLADLSAASGVNVQVIHRIERGHTKEPKRSTLTRIIKPFGWRYRDLIAAVPDTHPKLQDVQTVPTRPRR